MEENGAQNFWAKLFHRWFIEYNPLYLVSAALVLGGVSVMSRELVRSQSSAGILGVAAISETYAWTLIAGTLLLTRIGFRRPAVQLALITALYQCDPTLHTETCAYLGWVGGIAALVWLASFAGKLFALGWALGLRLSRTAIVVPMFGALGVLVLPRSFPAVSHSAGSAICALWVFALFASAFWTSRSVESVSRLDAWGRTVLGRGTRAVWLLWGVLTLSHVLFWADEFELGTAVLLPTLLLLGTRWLRNELAVWAAVSGTLLFVAWRMPASFSLIALMSAAVFCLRAFRMPSRPEAAVAAPAPGYRFSASEPALFESVARSSLLTFVPASRDAIGRLLTGALFATYLSAWTTGWSGGPWPEHRLWLDLAVSAAAALLVLKARARVALLPLAANYFHFAIRLGWITAPSSALEWGMASVSTGFGLLIASLFATWRIQASKGVADLRQRSRHRMGRSVAR